MFIRPASLSHNEPRKIAHASACQLIKRVKRLSTFNRSTPKQRIARIVDQTLANQRSNPYLFVPSIQLDRSLYQPRAGGETAKRTARRKRLLSRSHAEIASREADVANFHEFEEEKGERGTVGSK